MGQAFTPSRSMIYGSPDRQAMVGVSNQLMGQLQQWSNEEISSEYRRQTSNASIAMEKERYNLGRFMDEHRNDPASWKTEFAKNKEAIRKSVLGGLTQPQAKQAAEMELNESFASWDSWIGESAAKQTAYNTNADFNTHLDSLYKESRQYRDQTDMMGHLESGLSLIESGFNGGTLPVDKLPTKEVADSEKRNVARHIVGNYLLQQALSTGDETLVDKANEVAPKDILDDQPLFGPEELGLLRKRYDAAATAAKGEANKARTTRSEAFEKDITIKLLSGQFALQDDKGNPINIRDAILSHPDLTPEKIRTLENLYQEQAKAFAKDTKYTEGDKLQAYIDIRSETDPQKKLDLLKKHASGLGFNEVQSLYDKMNDPAADDSQLSDGLNKTIGAIRKIRTDQQVGATEEEAAKTEIDLLRLHTKVLRTWDAHPDWTEGQRIDEMEKILAPAKDEAGKQTVRNLKRLDRAMQMMAIGSSLYASPLAQGMYNAKQAVTNKAPTGLEKQWPKMSAEERESAKRMLANGIPLNRIVEKLK